MLSSMKVVTSDNSFFGQGETRSVSSVYAAREAAIAAARTMEKVVLRCLRRKGCSYYSREHALTRSLGTKKSGLIRVFGLFLGRGTRELPTRAKMTQIHRIIEKSLIVDCT